MTIYKKALSILMCLVLIVGSVGCRKSSKDSGYDQIGPYFTYSAAPLNYEVNGETGVNYCVSFGDSIMATVNVNYTYEQEMASNKWQMDKSILPTDDKGDYVVPTINVLIYDYDGNLINEIPLKEYVGLFNITPNIFVDSEDNIHVLASRPYDNKVFQYEHVYLVFDKNGELVRSNVLSLTGEGFVDQIAYSSEDKMVMLFSDNNGYNSNTYYISFDDSGNEINRTGITEGYYIGYNFYMYEDRVCVILTDIKTSSSCLIKLADYISGSDNTICLIPDLPTDGERYFSNSKGLIYQSYDDKSYYLFDPADGSSTLLADMSNMDVGAYATYLTLRENNNLSFIGSNGLDSTQWLINITSCDTDVNADKTTIRVAGIGINEDPFANYMKFKFNSTNPDYRVEFIDYRESYGYELSDEELGMVIAEDLMYQRLSGDSPDVIMDIGGTFPFYTISNEECLVSLNDYYSKSLSENNYDIEIIEKSKIDNCLYSIPLAFSINGFVTSDNNYANANDWTFDDFSKIASEFDGQMIPNLLPEDLLINQLQMSFTDYFDIPNRQVNFDSESFIKLLTWANSNADYVLDAPAGSYSYWFEDGMHYCDYQYDIYISTLYRISKITNMDVDVLGFPAEDESYIGASLKYRLAIVADSKNADASWEFIMGGFDKSPQDAFARRYFPISIDSFNYGLNYQLAYEIMDTSDVNLDKTLQKVVDLISRVNRVGQYDPQIFAIIREEAMAYFGGDKTAKEVADIIQDRCEIIMSERYG